MDTLFLLPLQDMLKNDLTALKETKKKHDKLTEDVDSTLSKYAGKRIKDAGIPEVKLRYHGWC